MFFNFFLLNLIVLIALSNTVAEFLNDILGHNYPELEKKLVKLQKRSMDEVGKDLKKAQQEGWIRKDLKISFVIFMINSINDKMLEKELIAMYDTPADLIKELTKFCFYGMSPMSEN